MLAEVRVMLPQEWIDEVHQYGGSLQYAIEDGLRFWLYKALRARHERDRRSLAARTAAFTRKQRQEAKLIRTRNAEGNVMQTNRRPAVYDALDGERWIAEAFYKRRNG